MITKVFMDPISLTYKVRFAVFFFLFKAYLVTTLLLRHKARPSFTPPKKNTVRDTRLATSSSIRHK